MNKTIKYLSYLISTALLLACANKTSSPQGGPKDETPPKVLKETPQNGAVNYKKKTIEVEFDEFVTVSKISENVLISPPQKKQPSIKSYGKKIRVVFEEELIDSTTYTIDFGSAIVDNNEGNPLEGYSFSFATGESIDTLQIAGTMLNAEDLSPATGIIVGIYQETDDSVFAQKPFMRIGKTNTEGKFSIKNIRQGTYRLFGLGDTSSDYYYQAGEGLALYDSLITPTCHAQNKADTIWIDSITIDTIKQRIEYIYEPQNIILRYFKENKQRRYLIRCERNEPHKFQITFSTPADSLPQLTATNQDWLNTLICQPNPTNDTIIYWITDTNIIQQDTLEFAMRYLKTDSLYNLTAQTDTLRAMYRRSTTTQKANTKNNQQQKQQFLTINTNANGTFEVYQTLRLSANIPLSTYDPTKIHLLQTIDTIQKPLPIKLTPLDSIQYNFAINHTWEPEKQYELQIDSAALIDIYGNCNNRYNTTFNIRSLTEYSRLDILLENASTQAIVQLLDEKGNPIRTSPNINNTISFPYLMPGDYYLRLFIDTNSDGLWTTGDFLQHQHPEETIYYPNKLTLRANWDFEETWDCTATPLLEQRPKELSENNKDNKK